jgi:uncharacterized coiled-coil protein SlyX
MVSPNSIQIPREDPSNLCRDSISKIHEANPSTGELDILGDATPALAEHINESVVTKRDNSASKQTEDSLATEPDILTPMLTSRTPAAAAGDGITRVQLTEISTSEMPASSPTPTEEEQAKNDHPETKQTGPHENEPKSKKKKSGERAKNERTGTDKDGKRGKEAEDDFNYPIEETRKEERPRRNATGRKLSLKENERKRRDKDEIQKQKVDKIKSDKDKEQKEIPANPKRPNEGNGNRKPPGKKRQLSDENVDKTVETQEEPPKRQPKKPTNPQPLQKPSRKKSNRNRTESESKVSLTVGLTDNSSLQVSQTVFSSPSISYYTRLERLVQQQSETIDCLRRIIKNKEELIYKLKGIVKRLYEDFKDVEKLDTWQKDRQSYERLNESMKLADFDDTSLLPVQFSDEFSWLNIWDDVEGIMRPEEQYVQYGPGFPLKLNKNVSIQS